MKVKRLIKLLEKLDPEMQVTWGTYSGSESGIVTGVSKIYSKKVKGENIYEACIKCKTKYNFGELI